MPHFTSGTENATQADIYYEDYGTGDPIILIHGWPLSSAMWEYQVPELVAAGHRVVSYDRRGFGASSKPWGGYDYDSLTADLDALIRKLDLRNITLVGFSMGGGEAVRYIGTYGQDRVKKLVLMSAITPYLVKTDDNPDGVPQEIFDGMFEQIATKRLPFLTGFTKNFFNYGTLGAHDVSEEDLYAAYQVGSTASPRASLECAKSFSSTDFRADLAKITVPTLIIHGDADKTVPYENSGKRVPALIAGSRLEVIQGAPHGLLATHLKEANQLLLEFVA